MAAHHHQIKAPTPTWLILKATPPPRDGVKKLAAAAAYSPLLLSPSVWQKAQDAKKSKADGGDALPASPRISCMGQVKGRPRRCSGARGSDRPAARGASAAHRGGKQLLERLTLGLFGRQRGRTSSRACSKVRDVPNYSSASSSLGRSSCGGGAAVAVCTLDPPLPVVKRPAMNENDNAPTLWERRRGGGGKTLETLWLT
ncbi:hypothetical protein E2562_001362 [Oryza meyeriana var. granulata]|uniref:Uncharacterized protein n=1 Tax=Oryza meyeriana var. granulata TaxID=110450 RepID=A0A6G1DBJ5_9ORYZ|nr:hypothetical protein E2562_001362 [Oryza meyeriana var. granulata]